MGYETIMDCASYMHNVVFLTEEVDNSEVENFTKRLLKFYGNQPATRFVIYPDIWALFVNIALELKTTMKTCSLTPI